MDLSVAFDNYKTVAPVLDWSTYSGGWYLYRSNLHTSEYQNLDWITKLSSPIDTRE